jgi:exonuclease-1
VAPYEADAQLAYLNKIGVAQVIITEDSDLLLFGCEKVYFLSYLLSFTLKASEISFFVCYVSVNCLGK